MSRRNETGTGGTPATAALERAGVRYTRHTYAHDARAVADGGSYGLEAAAALGLAPPTVFKTLLVTTDPAGRPGLATAVLPVTHRLDLKAVAGALGVKKVTMAEPRAAERSTGYVVGGISPVGQRVALPTVLDVSALEHPVVFVSGGRRGFDVGLDPADLVRVTAAVLAAVTR